MPEENKDAKIGVNDNIPAIYDKNGEILRNTKIYNENFFKFIYNFLSRYDKKNIEVVIFFITIMSILSQVFVYSYEAGKLGYFAIDRSVIKNFSIIEIIYNSFAFIILFTLFASFMFFTFSPYLKDKNISCKEYIKIFVKKYIIKIFINHVWLILFFVFKDKFRYNEFRYILVIFFYNILFLIVYTSYNNDKKNLISYFFSLWMFFVITIAISFFIDEKMVLLNLKEIVKIQFTTPNGISHYIENYIMAVVICIVVYLLIFILKKPFIVDDINNSKGECDLTEIIFYMIFIISIFIITFYIKGFDYAKNKEDFKVITYSENENDINRLIVYENSEKYVAFEYKVDEVKKVLEIKNEKQKLIPKDNIEFEIKNFKDYNITLEERK